VQTAKGRHIWREHGTYGVCIVFADQSDLPLYEGPSAVKAIHFAASAAVNFEVEIQTDFQTDALLPGELELSKVCQHASLLSFWERAKR
jgi:hypothetical protein